jgi:hypothetical protein
MLLDETRPMPSGDVPNSDWAFRLSRPEGVVRTVAQVPRRSSSAATSRLAAAAATRARGRRMGARAYLEARSPAVRPFHDIAVAAPAQWRVRYRQATARGCGCVIGLEEERLAAPDELVAHTLPGLARLSALALLVDGATIACAVALSREAAGVLRLLDRALTAHGRDHDYEVGAWLEHALGVAQATAIAVSRGEDRAPLSRVVFEAVDAVALAITALHRDRMGVPSALADALGAVLVLRAVGADGSEET